MTRRQWIGLAGVLFGAAMFAGITMSGTTPDSGGSGAAERYQEFWADSGNQDGAAYGTMVLTYATALLLLLASGLSWLVRRADDGPLPVVVLAGGVASAAGFAVGSALLNGAGNAAAESGYEPDGGSALLVEAIGYYTAAAAVMAAAVMAVAFSLSNRRARVVPQWTLVLTALLALAGLGSIFTAWIGFMVLPLWGVVVGVCLLVTKEPAAVETTPQKVAV